MFSTSTPKGGRQIGRARRVLAATVVIFALSLAMAPPAFAAPTFTQWQLNLWPEYDDPRLLVIFNPILDPSVPLPYTLSYGIPITAQMGMACQLLSDGAHDCQPQQSSVTGDVKTISFSAPTVRELYMEYYMDPFDGERPDARQFTYSFVPPADIGVLSVQIKQPKDAEGFVAEPAPQQTLTDAEGYSYLTYTFNDVKAGQAVDFSISYTRPTWTPLVQGDSQTQPVGGQPGTGGASTNLLLWAVVGLLAVIAVIVYRNQKAKV